MQKLQSIIESAFENCSTLSPQSAPADLQQAVSETITLLDQGKVRVAEKINGTWQIHQWLKKAILLYFRLHDNQVINGGFTHYLDKIPLKFSADNEAACKAQGARIVPSALARKGAYLAPNTILMPSYVNIGAYIDSGTMVDTWAASVLCPNRQKCASFRRRGHWRRTRTAASKSHHY